MSQFFNDAIFWVEVDKIRPNPFQPRKEFDEAKLQELSDSIKMYGVMQPLVVTRKEVARDDGSFSTEYELISGERRLRASKLAGLAQVPVLIRDGEDSDRERLEMAIIENLQREDLNVVDRARAFKRLVDEFGLKHGEIGKKMGRSREYVANTLRILNLPEEMIDALAEGKITEGHTRPLLMLIDRPEEQRTLFKEILAKKMTVREAEGISRRIAYERARRPDKMIDPDMIDMEDKLKVFLGTRVRIEKKEAGGRISIDFFSVDDLKGIIQKLENLENGEGANTVSSNVDSSLVETEAPIDDRTKEEKIAEENSEDLYSIKNFSV